jgi:hypothetical protein
MPNMEAPMDPFGRIFELQTELAAIRALMEECKAKIEELGLRTWRSKTYSMLYVAQHIKI